MKRTVFVLALVLVVGALPAIAADGNLPGGTAISVAIDDPADGDTFAEGAAVDVHGTAAVGVGTPIKDTTVVYVIDVSGSTFAFAGVNCDGVAGIDRVLTCEKEGIKAANAAAADANSSVANSGVVAFQTGAAALDVDPAAGTQLLTAPGPNIDAAVAPLTSGGGTNFTAAITASNTVFADAAVKPTKLLIFITDGFGSFGGGALPAGTVVSSFAVGTGSACTGNLLAVTALGAAGSSCEEVTDPSDLADAITDSIGSSLDSLDLEVDGGGATAIPNSDIDPDLPLDGPDSVDYWTTTAGLSAGTHEICVTANGTDAGGQGSVEDCVDVTLVAATCVETENPHGNKKPTAPANGGQGQNQDGFYVIGSTSGEAVFVLDDGSGSAFGPFADGTDIKYTEDDDAVPSVQAMGANNGSGNNGENQGNDTDFHVIGTGDALVVYIDGFGNVTTTACLVPPPPQ